ncbi:MAG: TA system VapC family ribonuclease toxin [Limisphaerales bacterium]
MTADLPDTNVWVALATNRHRHHQVAVEWFESLADNASARFCRMTQNSFLRLMTVVEFQQEDTLSNADAIAVFGRLRGDPRVGWSDEPPGVEDHWFKLAGLATPSPKRWMDAYLAAFALAGDLRLVTFDSGFRQHRQRGLETLVLGTASKA